jgi:hypothetical protein
MEIDYQRTVAETMVITAEGSNNRKLRLLEAKDEVAGDDGWRKATEGMPDKQNYSLTPFFICYIFISYYIGYYLMKSLNYLIHIVIIFLYS